MPRRRAPCACLAWFAVSATAFAQAPADGSPEQLTEVAAAIRAWVAEFEQGRIGPGNPVRRGAGLQPSYVASARRTGWLSDTDAENLTHLDALQRLLFLAERYPEPLLADAVLDVAAAGLASSFLDLRALELRELGHWTLMRVDDQAVWFLILRAAAGERVPVLADLRVADRPEAVDGVTSGPSRRVAALQLIGRKNWPVFRSTLEAALADAEPRVRLAAAEAMAPPWRVESIRRVAQALANERHPVVSQALVRLLLTMLKRPPEDLDADSREILVSGALAQFGRCGWRTDMDLLDVVEAFPRKAAIPQLIAALDLEQRSPDALVNAINKRASPLLRERAAQLLRAMTGALIEPQDVAGWRDFWQREHANVVVPARLATQRDHGTRAQFFGVPVTGGSIAFLIDTSGSMADPPTNAPTTGPRHRRNEATRLGAAKEQLLLAAQAMPPASQYVVLTFAAHARSWTPTPIKPDARSLRSLTELLARLEPAGGTNLFDGLAQALALHERRFGDADAPKIDELFVLSDGEPTAGEVRDADDILQVVHEANKYARVRIHCVYTGKPDGRGASLLRRLAEANDGVFVQR